MLLVGGICRASAFGFVCLPLEAVAIRESSSHAAEGSHLLASLLTVMRVPMPLPFA